MSTHTHVASNVYYGRKIDSFAAITPQSLLLNGKHLSDFAYPPRSLHQLSFFDLYNCPLPTCDDLTTGRFAGALSLLWYNSWEDINQASMGLKNPQSLRLYLPDYFMKYVRAVVEKGQISEQNLMVALMYALRFRMRSDIGVSSSYTSEARIFISSLLIANKVEDDVSYSTKTWAELSNIEFNELKKMEFEFLKRLDFRLHINANEWEQYSQFVDHFLYPVVDQMLLAR